jgi:hypothetical protein
LLVRRFWLQISVFSSPLFFVSTMFMILGFQSILMGLIAELLVRTYHESQSKPTYTIRRVLPSVATTPEGPANSRSDSEQAGASPDVGQAVSLPDEGD